MYGPVQALDAKQLQALGQRLGAAFSDQIDVTEVQQVGDGANHGTHFVALRRAGPPIGIKVSARGVPFGTEKEQLVAEIASMLSVPNSCLATNIVVQEIPAIAGRSATAIKWLDNAKKLQQLSPAEIDQIKLDPRSYLYQYGQWMAVGLILGVRDRHTGNWVWTPNGQLAMIDHEECCIQPGVIQDFYAGIDLITDRSQMKITGPAHKPGSLLAAGLRNLQKRLHARRNAVNAVLARHQSTSGYNSPFMDLSPADLVATVFSGLA